MTAPGQNPGWKGDSWQQVQQQKGGTITALWYDIEPFIYTGKEGHLQGVEYEIMEAFKQYVNSTYGYQLKVDWQNAGSFDNIYASVRNSRSPGLVGWSYFSITEERRKEIRFTPAYMADLNVLVTNNSQPFFSTPQEFTGKLNDMYAFTMENTTMEQDVNAIRETYYRQLRIDKRPDDYEVMQVISDNKKAFGYIPLSVYIVGLQRGIKVKRQNILSNRREGFAGIMPMSSDWQPVWEAFFELPQTRKLEAKIISKYLGSEVGDLVLTASRIDSGNGNNTGMELLSLEKDIVTQRLIDTAVDAQQQKMQRNILLILGAMLILIMAVLYNRYQVKQRLTRSLQKQNELIASQNEQIELMNSQLKIKILQSKLNPHFLFNSLNSIQYFIQENNRQDALLYIQRFSRFLRQILQSSDELLIPVQQEAALLEQYLWLEQKRFPGKFNYSIHVEEDEATEMAMTAPLLIHSIAEEALYVCILNDEIMKPHFIDISFIYTETGLQVKVKHNGLPRNKALAIQQSKNLNGHAGNSLVQRLDLINQNQKTPITVTYHDGDQEEQIHTTILSIPQ